MAQPCAKRVLSSTEIQPSNCQFSAGAGAEGDVHLVRVGQGIVNDATAL
jgi:hypothetical protein